MTRTGQLNRLLRVDKNTSTIAAIEAGGYQEPDWTEKARMWCSVMPQPGTELIQVAAEQWQQPMRVTMRWDDRLATLPTAPTLWRLHTSDGLVVYDVLTAVNVGLENKWLELICIAGSVVPLT